MSMVSEFKEFIMRGNVMDMAVGVIVGGAFNAIVSSVVDDIVMPFISLLTGRIDFTNLFITLDGSKYNTLSAAKDAGAAVFAYGNFIQNILQFLIVAFVLFMLIKAMNKLRRKEDPEPVTKICPFCKSEIPKDAIKCAHCASDLNTGKKK